MHCVRHHAERGRTTLNLPLCTWQLQMVRERARDAVRSTLLEHGRPCLPSEGAVRPSPGHVILPCLRSAADDGGLARRALIL